MSPSLQQRRAAGSSVRERCREVNDGLEDLSGFLGRATHDIVDSCVCVCVCVYQLLIMREYMARGQPGGGDNLYPSVTRFITYTHTHTHTHMNNSWLLLTQNKGC